MDTESKKLMLPERDENWKGYTLEELRYKRAITQLRREVAKEKLIIASNNMQKEGIVPMGSHSRNILGKMMNALDYMDYGIIAYKAGGKLLRFFKLFKRK